MWKGCSKQLNEGKAAYDTVSDTFVTGKLKITRQNITLLAWAFRQSELRGITGHIPFHRILLWMVRPPQPPHSSAPPAALI